MIIQLRRGTAAQWTEINPILREGEVGVELHSSGNRFKIGNGTKSWNELPYGVPRNKEDLGLGNVDNTSDVEKPISEAAQTALDDLRDLKAPLESPAFTGSPTAPTPATADNDTSIATTEFVKGAVAGGFAGTALGTADLNTITTPGLYTQSTSLNATLERNYPASHGAWVIEVVASGSSGRIQRATRHWQSGWQQPLGFWQRSYNGASVGWTGWQYYPSMEVNGADVKVWDPVASTNRSLMSHSNVLGATDLNTVTSAGTYYQNSQANTTLALNYPLAAQIGVLEVIVGSSRVHQRWTPTDSTSNGSRGHYIRHQVVGSPGTWHAWRYVPSMEVSDREVRVWDQTAQTHRSLAVTGIALGTSDLDTITTPGMYAQGDGGRALLSMHYPKGGAAGSLLVETWTSGQIHQTYTPMPNLTGSVPQGFGFWRRSTRGSSWSPWIFFPSQRVDNTAGRAIYTWDDTANREQLIYGDTGWRELKSTTQNGWTADYLRIRRVGYVVEMAITGVNGTAATADTVFYVPPGFSVPNLGGKAQFIPQGSSPVAWFMLRMNNTGGAFQISGGPGKSNFFPTALHNLVWTTTDPWPTTLPGTVVGTIPNL